MTTITIERAFLIRVLEQLDVAQSLLERSRHHAKMLAVYEELRTVLAAPATAPKQPRPFVPWSKEAEMLESWAAQPATAPAHTEAEASKT